MKMVPRNLFKGSGLFDDFLAPMYRDADLMEDFFAPRVDVKVHSPGAALRQADEAFRSG